MNVAEFIEWLKTQDQEAEVHVIKGQGYAGEYREVPFEVDDEIFEHYDWGTNPRIKEGDPRFGKRQITFGQHY